MKGTFDAAIAGVIAIGLVTAFGIHSQQLSTLVPAVGKSSSQILGTAENG